MQSGFPKFPRRWGNLCLGFVFVLRKALVLLRLALNFWSCYLHHVLLRDFWGKRMCICSSDSRREEVPKPSFFFPHLHHTLETSCKHDFFYLRGAVFISEKTDEQLLRKEGEAGQSTIISHNPECALWHSGVTIGYYILFVLFKFFFYLCIYVPACLPCTAHMQYPQWPEEGDGAPGIGATGGCWADQCACWELNPGPLKGQQALLATGPPSNPPPPHNNFLYM